MQGSGFVMLENVVCKVKDFYMEETPQKLTTYNIKPFNNINNKENLSITNAIANMYMTKRKKLGDIDIKSKVLFTLKKTNRCYWDIVFKKNSTSFYLTIPDEYSDLILTKSKSAWGGSCVSESKELANIDNMTSCDNCAVGNLVLKTYNFRSLSTDMSNQYPLTNMMSITKALEKDEFVRVNIAIEPTNRLDWVSQARDEKEMFKKGKVLDNEVTLKEQIEKYALNGLVVGSELFIEFKMLLLESILGIFLPLDSGKSKQSKGRYDVDDDEVFNSRDEKMTYNAINKNGTNTNYKMTSEVFKTKVTIISQSNSVNRARLSMLAVANAYKDLTEDNEIALIIQEDKSVQQIVEQVKRMDVVIDKKCILSDKELAKMIQLPQKTLQKDYKMDIVDTRESEVPKELQGGKIRICEVEEFSKDKKTMVTFPESVNLMARKTVFMGGENAGKTTALKRTVSDCYKAKISTFVIDNLENCKMSTEVGEVIPVNDRVIYDIYNDMPPLAFTEVSKLITEDMNKMKRLDYANMISQQVAYFINSITDDDTTGKLSANMKRFLHSSCMVTFIRPNATINDAFDVLRRWDKRNEAIRYAKYSKCFDEDDDVFFDLEELHRREDSKKGDKGKIIGTRDDLIVGIVNRINTLYQNPRIKAMLKAAYDPNDDIDKHIQNGKSIFVKIPQNKFPDPSTRDMLSVFYLSRIWLTVQIREENKDSRLCNVVLDEIKTVPTVAEFLEKHLTEFRRHRLGLLLSAHGLAQFGKLLTQLKDSGANFIIMPPVDKKNIEMLKEEILPFELDEVLNIKPFHALCVINYGNQYWKGIGKLPLK